jgi:DNA-binding MarR family transcriptional regulator/GNAT superfamily N-acetyltransferase
MKSRQVEQVRSFNRAVTKRVGALEDSYLARGRPLGEARLIFEVGPDGIDLRMLRERLGLDSGYLSRLLRSLEAQGIVDVLRKPEDARARQVVLTPKGRDEYSGYDRSSDDLAASILDALSPTQRERLTDAMGEVERLLRASSIWIELEPAGSTDASWCLGEYYAELQRRFDSGFDPSAGNNFDPAEITPPMGWFLIARLDGEPVGCGALKRLEGATGEIKRVWISPDVRGMGLASRIMDRLEQIAAAAGFARILLDTNRALVEARAMYLKRGYVEIARYNDNPYADHWFERVIC